MIKIDTGIFIFENHFNADEISRTLDELRSSQHWEQAMTGFMTPNGVQRKLHTGVRNQKVISKPELFSPNMLLFAQKLKKLHSQVTDIPHGDLDFVQWQKSEQGDYFKTHRDQYPLALIAYLTDESDGLSGGTTDIWIGDKPWNIKPKKGSVLAFYAPNPHRGAEVLSGVKYTLLGVYR